MNIEQLAEITHETNRAYCATIGDFSQPKWADAPEWQRVSAINGVKFHINELSGGRIPSSSASHDAWLAEKRKDGWKFGLVKDIAKKEHPCFVPYEELPSEQKMKDYLFKAVIKAFFEFQTNEVKENK